MTRLAPSALLLLAATARAADVDTFRPSSSIAVGEGTLQGEAAVLPEAGGAAGVIGGFAQDPVVRTWDDGRVEEAVAALLPVSVYGGWTVSDRARFDVFLPLYAHVEAPISGHSGAAVGDLRLQAVIPFASADRIQAGLVPRIELPTGTASALTRRGLGAGASLVMGGPVADADGGWLANLGLTGSAADPIEKVGTGSTVDGLLGGWWEPDPDFRIGLELDAQLGLVQGARGTNTGATAGLFAQQIVSEGVALTLGAATGLRPGLGTPSFRATAGITVGARPPQTNAPIAAIDPAESPEPESQPESTASTPSMSEDRDGDGIVDLDDACPDQAGPVDERPDLADGCDKGVYLTANGIRHGPVRFLDGDTELDPTTRHQLDAVFGLLITHPELGRVEVQSHLPLEGEVRDDQARTERRAATIRTLLIEQGVAEARLIARGFGSSRPIDTNRTSAGRGRNDRVEFLLLDQTPPPPPTTGPGLPMDPLGSPGVLTVVIEGGLKGAVFVDGRRLVRAAPFTDESLPAGEHEIRVSNLQAGIDLTQRVKVHNGEFVRVVIPLPTPAPESQPEPTPVWEPVRQVEPEAEDPPANADSRANPPSTERRPPRSSDKRPPRSSDKR